MGTLPSPPPSWSDQIGNARHTLPTTFVNHLERAPRGMVIHIYGAECPICEHTLVRRDEHTLICHQCKACYVHISTRHKDQFTYEIFDGPPNPPPVVIEPPEPPADPPAGSQQYVYANDDYGTIYPVVFWKPDFKHWHLVPFFWTSLDVGFLIGLIIKFVIFLSQGGAQ